MRIAGLTILLLLAGPGRANAQPSTHCLDAFEGVWRGNGSVLGRTIVMEQRWSRALMGSFHELQMRHLVSDTSGKAAFEGRGFYRSIGSAVPDSIRGIWMDGRGVTFSIRGDCRGGVFVSDWSGERESGRTVYRVLNDEMDVSDSVFSVGGGSREFGRSRLKRSSSGR